MDQEQITEVNSKLAQLLGKQVRLELRTGNDICVSVEGELKGDPSTWWSVVGVQGLATFAAYKVTEIYVYLSPTPLGFSGQITIKL